MATELGGSQITTLMETLPGIANVLRSPVADAIINLIRASVRLRDFQYADADEMVVGRRLVVWLLSAGTWRARDAAYWGPWKEPLSFFVGADET